MIGYKVMNYNKDLDILISGRNSQLTFFCNIGAEIKMPENGVYIGIDKHYVMDYYSGLAENEVLLTLEFDEKDIVTGNVTDRECELSVKKVKIIDFQEIIDGELQPSKNLQKNSKINQKNVIK